jgi:hypothetical protein
MKNLKFSPDYLKMSIHQRIDYKRFIYEYSNPFNRLNNRDKFYNLFTSIQLIKLAIKNSEL